jgi:hypothetical protein
MPDYVGLVRYRPGPGIVSFLLCLDARQSSIPHVYTHTRTLTPTLTYVGTYVCVYVRTYGVCLLNFWKISIKREQL